MDNWHTVPLINPSFSPILIIILSSSTPSYLINPFSSLFSPRSPPPPFSSFPLKIKLKLWAAFNYKLKFILRLSKKLLYEYIISKWHLLFKNHDAEYMSTNKYLYVIIINYLKIVSYIDFFPNFLGIFSEHFSILPPLLHWTVIVDYKVASQK